MRSTDTEGRQAVQAEAYTSSYFLEECGGIEFFKAYGTEVLKPYLMFELKRFPPKAGMTAVDLGCGRGEFLPALARSGARVIGLDYAPEALRISRQVVAGLSEGLRARISVLASDAKGLPLEDGCADVVYFNDVFEHLHDWELRGSLCEIKRVLKPSGMLVLHTSPNRLYYKLLIHPAFERLAALAKSWGLPVRQPAPVRSEWDRKVHVNEQDVFSLRRILRESGFAAKVELLPNMKFLCEELYGQDLPCGFPLKQPKGVGAWLYMNVFFRMPLKIFLARHLQAWARPLRLSQIACEDGRAENGLRPASKGPLT
ncbi:MAG: class I SAM-dependent methyltransferase [Elusimicrobia bacterium]|nr:class I SAM-dependent methyltransferase [Elusimicrobiota bacterium]